MDGWMHDIVKEIIGSLMIAAATWLGDRVRRFAKDLNCLFNRVRALEEHTGLKKEGEKTC